MLTTFCTRKQEGCVYQSTIWWEIIYDMFHWFRHE